MWLPHGIASDQGQPADPGEAWFAIRVKSRCEKAVTCSIEGKGYVPFCPLYRVRRASSGHTYHADLPLFPGYVFAKFRLSRRLPILQVPGVVHLVSAGRTPVPVDDAELEAIQKVAASGLPAKPWPFTRVGQRVVVDKGPLKGLEGILVQARNSFRVVASINMLQRSVSVELDRDIIRPLGPSPAAG